MTRHARRATASLVVVTLLLAVAMFAATTGCAKKVVVPDVSKSEFEQAKALLESKGLKATVRARLANDALPENAVVSQEPPAGSEVEKGTEVALTLSTGPEGVSLPNLVGYDVEEAKRQLQALGLRFKVTKRVDPSQPGKVLDQNPQATTSVLPDSMVEIFVADTAPPPLPDAPATQATGSAGSSPAGASGSGGSPKSTGYVVAVDAGHQARANTSPEPIGPGSSSTKAKVTGGASGASTGQKESELNLAVALRLQAALKAKGVRVVMIRVSESVDISNSERAQMANRAGADLFIRIHADSGGSSASGSKTLVPSRNQWTGPIYAQSRRAADKVQPQLVRATGFPNDGIVERGDITGFNWSKVPVVLLEMGFLSNPNEDRTLAKDSVRRQIASNVADGILSYLKSR